MLPPSVRPGKPACGRGLIYQTNARCANRGASLGRQSLTRPTAGERGTKCQPPKPCGSRGNLQSTASQGIPQAAEKGGVELLVVVFLIEQRERGLDEVAACDEAQQFPRVRILHD